MNDLVVGGAGFIGSQLCDALLARGDKVVCLDNLMRGTMQNLDEAHKHQNFLFIKGDATDQTLLQKILKENKTDFVYHLAANSDIQASANDPSIEFTDTCTSTWSILSAMRNCGVKKLFFASSSALYGFLKNGETFSEESPMTPISYYGSAKMASEGFISAFTYMNDMDSLVFRFPNVIGKRLTHGVIFDFINRLKNNPNELIVLGNGTQEKQYILCDDLINAIMFLAPNNKGLNIYEVGTEGATTVKYIAETVVSMMKLHNCKIVYGSDNFGWKGDVPHFQYDLAKIHKTGWKAKFTSNEAVEITIKRAIEKKS
jgi:UDP-glucose 4-epimerase